ncbi:hypothetical protein AVEN_115602-1 [Araneus ventricosus]|uniref:Uncharacterized protein n=1 Tax=Araneus ventricosus TaxID=182803 RepID=A0A4Y2N1Q9_ARAVE|nr:hypothetical protein AVEN_115602-1 [Araneus ventricosus]
MQPRTENFITQLVGHNHVSAVPPASRVMRGARERKKTPEHTARIPVRPRDAVANYGEMPLVGDGSPRGDRCPHQNACALARWEKVFKTGREEVAKKRHLTEFQKWFKC